MPTDGRISEYHARQPPGIIKKTNHRHKNAMKNRHNPKAIKPVEGRHTQNNGIRQATASVVTAMCMPVRGTEIHGGTGRGNRVQDRT